MRAVSALLASVDSWHSIDFWASVFCFVGGIVSAAGGVGGGDAWATGGSAGLTAFIAGEALEGT